MTSSAKYLNFWSWKREIKRQVQVCGNSTRKQLKNKYASLTSNTHQFCRLLLGHAVRERLYNKWCTLWENTITYHTCSSREWHWVDENPLKDGPNFSFTICYIAKQTNKQKKYNGPWAIIDYEQSLFFLSPYRERYARDTQMTTHATEGALVSRVCSTPPRARNPSHSGAVTSRKNGTTVSRGFRRSYGLIWPGRCPV